MCVCPGEHSRGLCASGGSWTTSGREWTCERVCRWFM
nr:MAG TPA: hypothetical protein [Caudoviricetes sp.]